MKVEQLVSDPPLVHVHGTYVWALAREPLTFIWDTVELGWNTVETGLGASTVAFAVKGARHTCITPSADEVERLKDYCAIKNISLKNLNFITGGSQRVVHSLPTDDLDFVLIDGGHGFPLPFLDWFYLAERLRVGGLVMVDDTQLWTGKVLAQFLRAEPGWSCEKVFARTAVFRMTAPFAYHEWTSQPYVRRKSWWPTQQAKMARGAQLLLRGNVAELWAGMKKRVP